MTKLKQTTRSRVKRLKDRGHYDRDTVNAILDAGVHCHIAYVIDGQPFCTPTLHWRSGGHVYWHGSRRSRFLQQAAGSQVCLTVTHLDGFVLARSAFNHSVNYRSVMLFGQAEPVEEPHKSRELQAMVERLFPGRWETLRPITRKELNATTVLRMAIAEGSAKVRASGVSDNREDYALPIWAGLLPLEMRVGRPQPDPGNLEGVSLPRYLRGYRLPGQRKD